VRRVLGALLVIAALIAVAVFFADRPGAFSMEWDGWHIDTTVSRALLLLAMALVVLGAILWLLRKIMSAPAALVRARRERRRRDGYRALTQGMVAVAAGDAEEAHRLARRADNLLAEPPLTLLLRAQSAQLNGDEQAARTYFTAMLERPETEFLGVRGLLTQALKTQDEPEALALAERARRLRPKTGWALRQLAELQARAGQWKPAEATLALAMRRKALPPTQGKRMQAALLLEQSREAAASGDVRGGLTLAERAQDTDPGFAPAAAWYATLLRNSGRVRQAARALEAAWRLTPVPALAEIYRTLAPDEAPLARVKRMQTLVADNPDHPESHLVLAETALGARLWGEARRHLALAGLDENGSGPVPSARAARLMAEVEESERGDNARGRLWLSRAAAAAASDPTYVCGSCNAESATWVALCPVCRAFARLDWRAPHHAPRELLSAPIAPPPASAASVPPTAIETVPWLTTAKAGR